MASKPAFLTNYKHKEVVPGVYVVAQFLGILCPEQDTQQLARSTEDLGVTRPANRGYQKYLLTGVL